VKTTITTRNIANPRRTTLAHLKDADELTTEAIAEDSGTLGDIPAQTANPRRTTLIDAPTR